MVYTIKLLKTETKRDKDEWVVAGVSVVESEELETAFKVLRQCWISEKRKIEIRYDRE